MRLICVDEFGNETLISEFAVLSFLANSDKLNMKESVDVLKRGERLYINENNVYIQWVD